MDAKLKAKWLAALRSGEYKQGQSKLRADDSFCCLGVLCDLVDASRWENLGDGRFSHGPNGLYPGSAVYDAAKLDAAKAGLLANMNDEGASFAQIADHIEQFF